MHFVYFIVSFQCEGKRGKGPVESVHMHWEGIAIGVKGGIGAISKFYGVKDSVKRGVAGF